MDRQTDRQTEGQTDGWTDIHANGKSIALYKYKTAEHGQTEHSEIKRYMLLERQTDRQTDRQTNPPIERQSTSRLDMGLTKTDEKLIRRI